MTFRISDEFVAESNARSKAILAQDYEALSRQLARRKVDIEAAVQPLADAWAEAMTSLDRAVH